MGIQIKNIKKTFTLPTGELEVLKDVSLDIEDGEIISIVGGSGCGKSTLLRIIAGLETATSGEILIDGKKLDKPSQKDVGMIFQESRLFPWKTVEKNIEFGIWEKKAKSERRKSIQEHIDLVGLQGFEKALPYQLSGGMQQRVSIARSLINQPKVLLLDEPFGALDAFTRINMQREVLRIWEQEKKTLILVTHDIDEALYMGDRVVVMSSKPGVVQKIVDVDLGRPHDRTSADFAVLRRKVFDEFFERENGDDKVEYFI